MEIYCCVINVLTVIFLIIFSVSTIVIIFFFVPKLLKGFITFQQTCVCGFVDGFH